MTSTINAIYLRWLQDSRKMLISTNLSPSVHPSAGLWPWTEGSVCQCPPQKDGTHKLRCIWDQWTVWDLIIVLVRLQGLNRSLPNLLLSFAMSKLPSPANTGCHSTDLFLNTCLCFIKWTSLPSQGWREELHLAQERKSHLLTTTGLHNVGGEAEASASWITSRKISLASEEQYVPISQYHCQRSSHKFLG